MSQRIARRATTATTFFSESSILRQQHPEAFAPFKKAFAQFVHLAEARGGQEIREIRQSLTACLLESERKTLVQCIPELSAILGRPDAPSSSSSSPSSSPNHDNNQGANGPAGRNAHRRFLFVFVRFVRAIGKLIQEREGKPLVIVLDDLQWTDSSSLDLLMAIAVDKETAQTGGLLLVGTCRGNQVSFHDKLAVALRDLETTAGVKVTEIRLDKLGSDTMAQLVASVLPSTMPTDMRADLAEWIREKTAGNVLFALQLLRALQDEGLLYAKGEAEDKEVHYWDAQGSAEIATVDVIQLLANRMSRLPVEVQEVLKVASCVGVEFSENLLSHLTTTVVSSQILPVLCAIEESGLITLDYDSGEGRWMHDCMQKAATLLIPDDQKEAFHVSIGRKLRDIMANDKSMASNDNNVFLVVDQMLLGASLLESEVERSELAHLCLRAGKSAVASSAFSVAVVYLEAGLALLQNRSWRDHYELCLDLTNTVAEVSYWNGDFKKVDRYLHEIFTNARSFEDTMWAQNTCILSLGAQNQTQPAIDRAFKLLAQFGEKLPKRGNRALLLIEVVKTRRALRGVTDDEIMALPTMRHPDKQKVMALIGVVGVYLFWHRPDLFPLVVFRGIRICLQCGLTGIAGSFFGAFSVALVKMGEVDQAHRFSRLALRIVRRFEANEWLARSSVPVYSMVLPLRESYSNCLKPLLRAHSAGLVSGDIEFSILSASLYCQMCVVAGVPLGSLMEEIRLQLDLMEHHGQLAVKMFTLPVAQFCMNFLGGEAEADPLVLSGTFMNEKELEDAFTDAGRAYMQVLKMTVALHLGYFPAAGAVMERLQRLDSSSLTCFAMGTHHFHECLTDAVLGRQNSQTWRIRRARRGLKKLKTDFLGAPDNFANKTYLVEAELAMYDREFDVVSLHFQRSIDFSREAGLLHEEALAYERWGRALLERGLLDKALECLEKAKSLYQEWNANIKVKKLDSELRVFMEYTP